MQDSSQVRMKAVFPAFDGFVLPIPGTVESAPKRALDVIVSALLVLLLSPLLALVSLAILLDSARTAGFSPSAAPV